MKLSFGVSLGLLGAAASAAGATPAMAGVTIVSFSAGVSASGTINASNFPTSDSDFQSGFSNVAGTISKSAEIAAESQPVGLANFFGNGSFSETLDPGGSSGSASFVADIFAQTSPFVPNAGLVDVSVTGFSNYIFTVDSLTELFFSYEQNFGNEASPGSRLTIRRTSEVNALVSEFFSFSSGTYSTSFGPGSYVMSINALPFVKLLGANAPEAVYVQGAEARYNFSLATLPGGVPEPASWALMLFGFGFSGAMLRRRSAVQALA